MLRLEILDFFGPRISIFLSFVVQQCLHMINEHLTFCELSVTQLAYTQSNYHFEEKEKMN